MPWKNVIKLFEIKVTTTLYFIPNFQRNNSKLCVYLLLLSAKRYEHAQKTINSRLGKKIRDRCRIWNPRNSYRLAQIHGNWNCPSNTKSWRESNFTCVQHLYYEFRLGFRDKAETNRVLRIPLICLNLWQTEAMRGKLPTGNIPSRSKFSLRPLFLFVV